MKYQPLADFLSARNDDQWEASFDDVQRVLQFPLPPSAHEHQAWWANQAGSGRSQTKGWRSVGWSTSRVSLSQQQVTFIRDPANNRALETARADLDGLMNRAHQITGIKDRNQLTASALQALIDHHVRHGIATLGGSMPDYNAPARERP